MVADLILLGADVNEVNHSGKTCLHLSAEKGYTRVLEVSRGGGACNVDRVVFPKKSVVVVSTFVLIMNTFL